MRLYDHEPFWQYETTIMGEQTVSIRANLLTNRKVYFDYLSKFINKYSYRITSIDTTFKLTDGSYGTIIHLTGDEGIVFENKYP